MRSFKKLGRFANKSLFFKNMLIASKSALYPSCIGLPQSLTFQFTVISILRSLVRMMIIKSTWKELVDIILESVTP